MTATAARLIPRPMRATGTAEVVRVIFAAAALTTQSTTALAANIIPYCTSLMPMST